MGKLAKILGLLGVGAILLLLVLFMILWAALRSIPSPWPEPMEQVQLEPTRPFLDGADVTETNAFFYIRQLGAYTDLNTDSFQTELVAFGKTGWIEGAYTNLAQWASANSDPLGLVEQAAAMSFCQLETLSSPSDLIPYVGPLLHLSKGLGVEAERAAATGNWDAASTRIRQLLIVNDHLHRGGSLICRLVGVAGGSMGCEAIQRMAEDHAIPEAVALEFMALLETIEAGQESFEEAMRYERMFGQTCVDLVFSGDAEGQLIFDTESSWKLRPLKLGWMLGSGKETVANHLDLIYARLIDAASGSRYNRAKHRELDEVTERLFKKSKVQMFAHDPIGRIMAAMLIPAVSSTQEKHFEYVVRLRGTRLALALHRYEQAHEGQSPASLQDLVPAYLPTLPEDPFHPDGQPLQYRVEQDRWVVYSLGSNQADGGGQHNGFDRAIKNEHPDNYDLVFASDTFAQRRRAYAAAE